MLRLHGFSSSNYYNVPKLALLEKGVSFEEVVSYTGVGPKYRPEYLDKSPLGKVPALETDEGFISESRAILEYIERAHPEHPYSQNQLLLLVKSKSFLSSLNFILSWSHAGLYLTYYLEHSRNLPC